MIPVILTFLGFAPVPDGGLRPDSEKERTRWGFLPSVMLLVRRALLLETEAPPQDLVVRT